MIGNQEYLQLLLEKQKRPLKEHLAEAIKDNRVKNQYELPPRHHEKEATSDFAERLARNAVSHQFVPVVFNGESHYVAFGVAGPLITRHGSFFLVPARVVNGRWGIHYFLFSPNFEAALKAKEVFIRIDSGCLSGQLFGDITCDCREQLEVSFHLAASRRCGIIVNIPEHDGRGWGEYKMANQQLMHEYKLDTVAAARLFYGKEEAIDQRTYTETVVVLRAFGFNESHQFYLGTNNPRKIGAFTALGMQLKQTQSILTTENPNPILRKNLMAKSKEWGHKLRIQ